MKTLGGPLSNVGQSGAKTICVFPKVPLLLLYCSVTKVRSPTLLYSFVYSQGLFDTLYAMPKCLTQPPNLIFQPAKGKIWHGPVHFFR